MRKLETWLTGLLSMGVALLLPIAALEPAGCDDRQGAAGGLTPETCADGSAHLAMGCASVLL